MNDSDKFDGSQSTEMIIRKTISNRLCIDINAIKHDTCFHDLNMDSLDLAELIFLLEGQLQKQIMIDQTTNLKSIGDIVKLLTLHSDGQ